MHGRATTRKNDSKVIFELAFSRMANYRTPRYAELSHSFVCHVKRNRWLLWSRTAYDVSVECFIFISQRMYWVSYECANKCSIGWHFPSISALWSPSGSIKATPSVVPIVPSSCRHSPRPRDNLFRSCHLISLLIGEHISHAYVLVKPVQMSHIANALNNQFITNDNLFMLCIFDLYTHFFKSKIKHTHTRAFASYTRTYNIEDGRIIYKVEHPS